MCSSLLGSQGLEEKANSPLKAIKAAVFVWAQVDYKAITQMAVPANLNKKQTGKRSCAAQLSVDQTTSGGIRQTQGWHSTAGTAGEELRESSRETPGGTEQLPKPRLCPSPESKGVCQCYTPFSSGKKHITRPRPQQGNYNID